MLKTLDLYDTLKEKIVAAKEDNMLVTSFHPELTDDLRVHKYFLNMIKEKSQN
ncbi:hypothetical protein [[Clostridium] dakarense]|uniref:hypothetical protein n=1 Tax=Faecalimicrobium dakarense TaxID=1301100 RepID=UPI0004B8E835|nr:hypothetical protein [[Clostridium] dakarense]